jgi:hypothetical protein
VGGLDSADGELPCVCKDLLGQLPFCRSSGARSGRVNEIGGAGIRHGVVREVLRAHTDRIDMHSKPGDGSRFHRDATQIEEPP